MQIHGRERRSQLSLCLAAAGEFRLTDERAGTLMRDQIDIIAGNRDAVCGEAELGHADRRLLWRRQFLNALAFEGLESPLREVIGDPPDAARNS